jgi:hypothetical protein
MTRSRQPEQLRGAEKTSEVPFSLEWTVPYEDAIFHLGVHNLPVSRAHAIVAELAVCTQNPSSTHLTDLLGMPPAAGRKTTV